MDQTLHENLIMEILVSCTPKILEMQYIYIALYYETFFAEIQTEISCLAILALHLFKYTRILVRYTVTATFLRGGLQ